MKALQFPLPSVHSPVELKGKFKGITKEGDLTLKGWIDLRTIDMEMALKTRDIELRTFEPYYRKKVTAEIFVGPYGSQRKDRRSKAPHRCPGGDGVGGSPGERRERVGPFMSPRKVSFSCWRSEGTGEDPFPDQRESGTIPSSTCGKTSRPGWPSPWRSLWGFPSPWWGREGRGRRTGSQRTRGRTPTGGRFFGKEEEAEE